ncbi:hypothetical protein HRI_003769400 [Hibiscus trionum]|uniref:BHLH domain-containing protein n=1 Tax=Hibiscus trionum TaxID=183268 RepID=A0A9W7MHT3_HIBTR|nr:hypothetical protein HRI_003769400 [Hibiscus trionum]
MTGHLLNSPSIRDPDFMELVWENGEVLIRGLSSKITRTTSPFSSCYLSRSKDGVIDSTFDDPISGLSSAVLGLDKRRSDKQLVDCSNVVSVNNKFRQGDGDKLIADQVPGSSLKQKHGTSVMGSKEKDRVNFSMFLSSGATRATISQGLANVKPLPPTSGENEGNFMAKKMKSPRKESEPDEQMVASSSLCSRGSSNCPAYPLKRRYEDTDLSENTEMEESEGRKGSKVAKGKRKTEVHSLSERKRRGKINKKMRALKELIPNCTKVDKASMLDEAIEYLKSLQLQVQMMSMGNGVYLPPMMFTMQHLGGYSPMAVGMGMGMQMGIGCGAPTSLMPGAAPPLTGIPEATLNMLGLRSMSRPPFVSSAASFIPQSVQPPGSAATAGQVDLPDPRYFERNELYTLVKKQQGVKG